MKQSTTKSYFPIYLMLLGGLVIQIATPWRLSAMVSAGTWMILISAVFSLGSAFMNKELIHNELVAILVLVITSMFSVIYTNSLNYRNVVSLLCFLEIPFFITSYKTISNKVFIFTGKVFVILSIYYIYLSTTELSHIYYGEYGITHMEYITLGYANPNETAIHILSCVIVVFTMFFKVKSKLIKTLLLFDTLYMIYLLWCTESRTGFLIAMLFIFISTCYRKKYITSKKLVAIFSVPFIFFYIILFFNDTLVALEIMGDAFDTGRFEIYNNVINELNFWKILFGDFTFRFKNLHNGFFAIFATVGVIGLIAYIYIIYTNLKRITLIQKNQIALIGVLFLVVSTSTEATLITAGSSFAVSFLANYFNSIVELEGEYK